MARNWRKIQREKAEDTGELQETGFPVPSTQEQPMSESKDTETISRIEGMLEDLSLHGLNEVMEACKDRIAGKQNEAKSMLIEQFRSQAAALGLSLESLFPGGGRKRATGNIPVKYRDPVDASRVWSGRGMMAAWLRERQERGEDIEKYRVSETTAS